MHYNVVPQDSALLQIKGISPVIILPSDIEIQAAEFFYMDYHNQKEGTNLIIYEVMRDNIDIPSGLSVVTFPFDVGDPGTYYHRLRNLCHDTIDSISPIGVGLDKKSLNEILKENDGVKMRKFNDYIRHYNREYSLIILPMKGRTC